MTKSASLLSMNRPFVPFMLYNMIVPCDNNNAEDYIELVSQVQDVCDLINSDEELKHNILETYFNSFDKNTYINEVYKDLIFKHLDRFRIVNNPSGYSDYMSITSKGDLKVVSMDLNTYTCNTYEAFNYMLDCHDISFIPFVVSAKLLEFMISYCETSAIDKFYAVMINESKEKVAEKAAWESLRKTLKNGLIFVGSLSVLAILSLMYSETIVYSILNYIFK